MYSNDNNLSSFSLSRNEQPQSSLQIDESVNLSTAYIESKQHIRSSVVAATIENSGYTLYAQKLIKVGEALSKRIVGNRMMDKTEARQLMVRAFGGSDTDAEWNWKDFYEAQELAFTHILKESGEKLQSIPPHVGVWRLHQILNKTLTHTVRSEEGIALQQFSTPAPVAYLCALCAGITKQDLVLEPSAGTGLLASFAVAQGATVVLNELSERRAALLRSLFPIAETFTYDAEQIHDRLPDRIQPTVVLMNPPFSATPEVSKRNPDATFKHVRSSFQRLSEGGRMVVVSAHWFSPNSEDWKGFFDSLNAQISMTCVLPGDFYYKHGTTIKTRITVIDKVPKSGEPVEILVKPQYKQFNNAKDSSRFKTFTEEDIAAILAAIPERAVPVFKEVSTKQADKASVSSRRRRKESTAIYNAELLLPSDVMHVAYTAKAGRDEGNSLETLYEAYQPQRINIIHARPHPTKLCESAALAAVKPPLPAYAPVLPRELVVEGKLSFAQLETVVYAGQAHSEHLKGHFIVSATRDEIELALPDNPQAVQFRRGYFLGDGTGAGKGRQIAAIMMDNALQGRTKALWLSKTDTLLQEAKRDWAAVGGHEKDVVSISDFKLGTSITFPSGILFATYATLRSGGKQGKESRLDQIINWLGSDFDGVIALDESHLLGNATTEKEKIFEKEASAQAIAGLRLQNALPDARVVYVSATGATKVSNLAYATRLGLWQTGDFPFPTRSDFIASIESGGDAAKEVLCRDLKALGLYTSRNLSFDGVEYDLLEVRLTKEQVSIYDTYAAAFKEIHHNIAEALEVCNVTSGTGQTYSRTAKMSAHQQFESSKQRFFNHLLTSMKCPELVKAIQKDLDNDHAVVVQIVSTNESIIERRLNDIPVEEWNDLSIDFTPRDLVVEYLQNSFPTHLYKVRSDAEGRMFSDPVKDDDGNFVQSKEALRIRDALIEQISYLPPLPGALEHILHYFGHDNVAEITGRSRRVLRDPLTDKVYAATRSKAANIDETQAFMDGDKLILVFSDAGGTGRSYHSDLGAMNQRRRVHYLLEPGWRADSAIQGLGRSHRTNQASPPVFRPIVTDVYGERRFISTIAKRLNSLGALTRGQRETGGGGLFKAEDSLESEYAEKALHQFFKLLYRKQASVCTLAEFEDATGLRLTTAEGDLLQDLPGIPKFLNRLLALPIHQQNFYFEYFDGLLRTNIEQAKLNGTYETGVETLKAESFKVMSREEIYSHPLGGKTLCVEVEQIKKRRILQSDEAHHISEVNDAPLYINERLKKVAVVTGTSSLVNPETGDVIDRVCLITPTDRHNVVSEKFRASDWRKADTFAEWKSQWDTQVEATPKTTTDRFFLITGLLLPIWNKLDSNDMRVYRLRTDDGEVLLGRMISPAQMPSVAKVLGLAEKKLSPKEIYSFVVDEKQSYSLGQSGLNLKTSTVMQEKRLEVSTASISPGLVTTLKALGCYTDIIGARTRVFLPMDQDKAVPIIERIVERL